MGRDLMETVVNESCDECKKAINYLGTLPARAVEIGKSRGMARQLVQQQLNRVHALEEDGILTENGAHELQDKLQTAQCVLNSTDFALDLSDSKSDDDDNQSRSLASSESRP